MVAMTTTTFTSTRSADDVRPQPTSPVVGAIGPRDGVRLRRQYRSGDLIYCTGDTAHALYVLESGWVKLVRLAAEGREIAVALVAPGEPFGLEPIVGAPTRTLSAEALAPCVVRRVEPAEFDEWQRQRPGALRKLVRILWQRLVAVESQLQVTTTQRVTQRLAGLFVYLAARCGEPAPSGVRLGVRLTHATLASFVGSTRETVTTALGQLADEGLIMCGPRRRCQIVLPSVAALERFAEQSEWPDRPRVAANGNTDVRSLAEHRRASREPGTARRGRSNRGHQLAARVVA